MKTVILKKDILLKTDILKERIALVLDYSLGLLPWRDPDLNVVVSDGILYFVFDVGYQ